MGQTYAAIADGYGCSEYGDNDVVPYVGIIDNDYTA